MIPDPLQRTVKIPIKIEDGHPCLYPKGSLPELKEGAIGDLVMPAYALLDQKDTEHYTEKTKSAFLPANTRLLAQINPDKVPSKLWLDVQFNLPGAPGAVVEFILIEEQQVLLRGTKPSKLLPCKCGIAALNLEAKSINHAYTLISLAFEPDRISHTGNVFSKVYYLDDHIWKPLKALRGH